MGEDYGLILTVPAERADELEMRFQGHFGRPIWRIGSITSEPGLVLVGRGGERVRLEPRGWDAFRGYSKGPGGVP